MSAACARSLRLARFPLFLVACFALLGGVLVSQQGSSAAFPGANGRIFFTRETGVGSAIWSVFPDGSFPAPLTDQGYDPNVSADGTRIAFTSGRDGNREIYVMDADGSNQLRLTYDGAEDDDAVWAPDGARIAWGSFRIPAGIYVMNADGSNQQFLVTGEDPAWSPDGSRIAYTVESPHSQIWVMNSNGSNQTQITNDNHENQDPVWSPDGTRILYIRETTGDAVVMDANGSNQTNLTNGAFGVTDPAWSPDGTKIVFITNGGDVAVMNADGSNPSNITSTADLESNPDWAAAGGPFIVNSTNDPGDGFCTPAECTLREAISAANSKSNEFGADRVEFNIPLPGSLTITPLSALPVITDPVIIDGTTQPGCADYPCVELNGELAGPVNGGIKIDAGNSMVVGLVIDRFDGDAVDLGFQGGNTVSGNIIGTDATGLVNLGNTGWGVVMYNSSSNIIGGQSPQDGNLIAYNGFDGVSVLGYAGGISELNVIANNVIYGNNEDGIELYGEGAGGTTITGNVIGLGTDGATDRGNAYDGVRVFNAPANVIGGASVHLRNIISGNEQRGVDIIGSSAHDNSIKGNYIGADWTGTTAVGNAEDGIRIFDASSTTVGGPLPGETNLISGNGWSGVDISGASTDAVVIGNYIGADSDGSQALGNMDGVAIRAAANTVGGAGSAANVISGNTRYGVLLTGSGAADNFIQGNLIGVAAAGTGQLGNGAHGIYAWGSGANIIGGAEGMGNVIAHNGGDGVAVKMVPPISIRKGIRFNSIFANEGLGIDLEDDGVTPNDPGDTDTGGNELQNFPVLASAAGGGASTTIAGNLESGSSNSYTIDFYLNDACDPTGYGEGQFWIGAYDVLTDAAGHAAFSAPLPYQSPPGKFVAATATDLFDNTSEFSACIELTGASGTPTATPTASPTPTNTPTPTPTATAPSGLNGDADCNGRVDSVDALRVLRHVAGLTPDPACINAGNVKCDDGLSAVDALFILRYVALLPNTLPPECGPIGE